jgi:AcrR family transcriptional regulator
MPRTSDARQKMIQSAALLFRERGIHGTSFADVLAHSGAPRGSVYHHFNGGKTQLAEEAIRWAGEFTIAGVAATLRDHDPVEAIGVFRRQWGQVLRASDFGAGCPIVAAAVDGRHEPSVRNIAGAVFAEWEQVIARALRRRGLSTTRARSLATLLIASIEGALVLSRAQRSLRPLDRVCGELESLFASVFSPQAALA